MQYLHAAVAFLMAIFLGTQVLQSRNRKTKRAHVEDQLHSFIHRWVRKDSIADEQLFKETKQQLMLDWIDANPQFTRVDFCEHFDKLVDGHCESFAIAEYLRRRCVTASNDGAVLKMTENISQSA
jgi:hypothetical protein